MQLLVGALCALILVSTLFIPRTAETFSHNATKSPAIVATHDATTLPDVTDEMFTELMAMSHDIKMGDGDQNFLMISDPYCVVCRRAYQQIKKDPRVGTIHLVSIPLRIHPGADMAGAMVDFLAEKNLGKKAVELAYTMKEPETEKFADAAREVFAVFAKEFPKYFSETYAEEFAYKTFPPVYDAGKRANEMGFTGTPVFVINGKIMKGYTEGWLDYMLGYKPQ